MKILWDKKVLASGCAINVIGLIVVAIFILLPYSYQVTVEKYNYGNWETQTSEELGYRIDYPTGWSAETFPVDFEDLRRGLPKGIRAFFHHNYSLPFNNKKTAAIFWHSMDQPDLMEALYWGNETIERDRKSVGIRKTHVGVGEYPAVMRIYPVNEGTRRIVYVLADDGVFDLEFLAENYNEKYEALFNHMLESFEILD